MSFSVEVKEELARVEPVCPQCSRSTLAALLRIGGSLHVQGAGRLQISFASDTGSVVRLVTKIIHNQYELQTNIVMRRSVLHKNANYLVEVPHQDKLRQALLDLGLLAEEGGFEQGIKPQLIAKPCCAAAYVRGAFMASGSIADPAGNYHFEISVSNLILAEKIAKIMAKKGIRAKTKQRRNSYLVYLKSGEDIVSFLSMTCAYKAALRMEDVRVLKSVRSGVNRQINAELANQKKASTAAVDQVFAARKVIDAYGINKLSPALKEYIRLRVKHPEASLKELGEFANPPLSKSAVNHRVRRIMEMAQKIEDNR